MPSMTLICPRCGEQVAAFNFSRWIAIYPPREEWVEVCTDCNTTLAMTLTIRPVANAVDPPRRQAARVS
jgi:hypothetical protein